MRLYFASLLCWSVVQLSLLDQSTPTVWNPIRGVQSFLSTINEEIRFRKFTLEQYRQQLEQRLRHSAESFRKKQAAFVHDAATELSLYREQVGELYNETLQALKRQEIAIQKENRKRYEQSTKIYDSLEAFRNFYNETIGSSFMDSAPSSMRTAFWASDDTELRMQPLSVQLERISSKLYENLANMKTAAEESTKAAELAAEKALKELTKLQEDFYLQASRIEESSSEFFVKALSKDEMRNARVRLEKQLRRLESDGSMWIDERKAQLDSTLRTLQSAVRDRELLYEQLIGKKKDSVRYAAMNDATLKTVLDMIDVRDTGGDGRQPSSRSRYCTY